VNFYCEGIDKQVNTHFNVDAFMKCLSFEIDGERRTAPPWPYGPGWQEKGASNELDQKGELVGELESTAPLRANVLEKLRTHREYLAKFYPHQVGTKKIAPLSEEEIDKLVQKDDAEQVNGMLVRGDLASLSMESRCKAGEHVLINIPIKSRKNKAKDTGNKRSMNLTYLTNHAKITIPTKTALATYHLNQKKRWLWTHSVLTYLLLNTAPDPQKTTCMCYALSGLTRTTTIIY